MTKNYFHQTHNRTLSNTSKNPPTKSTKLRKNPYQLNGGIAFEQLIFDRLNTDSRQISKSIFCLKGSINFDTIRYSQHRKVLPKLSLSISLDREGSKQGISENMTHTRSIWYKKQRNAKQKKSILKYPIQIPASIKFYNKRPFTLLSKSHKKQKEVKKLNTYQIIQGNKTRLNFRPRDSQCDQKASITGTNYYRSNNNKANKIVNHLNKIKFGTFTNKVEDFTPWGLVDRFDDNIS